MEELTQNNVDEFLARFEFFDGAVVELFSYAPSAKLALSTVIIELKVTDTSLGGEGPFANLITIRIKFVGDVEFRFLEKGGGAAAVVNDRVVSFANEKKIFINFDPLHSKDWSKSYWTLTEVRQSEFYVGANSVYWEHLNGKLGSD